MKMTKCEKGHIYDEDKFAACPHCANLKSKSGRDVFGENQGAIDTAITGSGQMTYETMLDRRCVGWLVCIKGKMLGSSFTLYEGENRIGRSAHMDVCLAYEPTVSRENHAVIAYTEDGEYYFGQGGILTTEPDEKSHEWRLLKGREELTLGECKLFFVPLCDGTFSWK